MDDRIGSGRRRLMRSLTAVSILAVCSPPGRAMAQVALSSMPNDVGAGLDEPKGHTIGALGEVDIPLGGFRNRVELGLGLFARYERLVLPGFAGTVRLGYVYYLRQTSTENGVETDWHVGTFPLLFAPKLYLSSFFVHLEIGPVLRRTVSSAYDAVGQRTVGSTTSDMTAALGVGGGYRFRGRGTGSLVVAVSYQVLSLGDFNDTMQLAASLGYDYEPF